MALPDSTHNGKVQNGPLCSYHGPVRDPGVIKWVVIHDTEGSPSAFPKQPSADAIAAYGAGSNAQASWHLTVDDKKAIRCLPDDVVAWHAYSPANKIGLGVELCGWAKWSKFQWFLHQATLKRAAWQVAKWCIKYDIPPVILDKAGLKAEAPGITFHADITKHLGLGSHSDPGPNFPRGYFLFLVKRRIGWLNAASL